METVRLGLPRLIAARPLVHGLAASSPPGVQVLWDEPGALAALLERGRVDAALVPSIEFLRGAGRCLVEGPALVARSGPGVITLRSRRDPARVSRVAVDESARTATAVARFVLAHCCGVTPDLVVVRDHVARWRECADAVLLCADDALRHAVDPSSDVEGDVDLDLATMWCDLTAEPLTLAVLACNDDQRGETVARALAESRNAGVRDLSRVADDVAAEAGLPSDDVYAHLSRRFSWVLDADARGSLRTLESWAMRFDLLRRPRLERVVA